MADLAQLERALRNADAAGDVEAARTLAQAIRAQQSPPADTRPPAQRFMQNAAAGLVRGAGSIGATLLTPYDLLAGNTKSIGNPERRAAMDGAFKGLGVDTDGLTYGGTKLVGEIAGTAGAGSVLARGASMVPGAAAVAPVLDAVRTAGMTAGGVAGARGLGVRTLGGAVTGAAAAGLVNLEDADLGALIGGAAPSVVKALGAGGRAAGKVLRGPEQTPEIADAVRAAQQSGYVIPPTQARASLGNRLLEGMSGKISTAQNASARNQAVTNRMTNKALGLPDDVKLTPDLLQDLRRQAGNAYDTIGNAGAVAPGAAYTKALDDIAAPFRKAQVGFPNAKPSPVLDLVESLKSPSFDASSAVAKIKELRTAADDAYRTGNTDIGRASKAAAKALEDVLEDHLSKVGAPDALQQFREARQLIAKTYSVEKALNSASGSVDAKKLAAQLAKGKPLSGELKRVAQFASQFPKAAQPVEAMGSLPQLSPLDWAAAGTMTASSGPMGMLGLLARPAARGAALSGPVQRRLLQPQAARIPGLLLNDDLIQAGLLSAPILGTGQ